MGANIGGIDKTVFQNNNNLKVIADRHQPPLYPADSPVKHPHLKNRWRYFLKCELSQGCHAKIREAILVALNDANFKYILFDVLEGQVQDVNAKPEYESKNNDDDDGDLYMKIVLITAPTKFPQDQDPGDDPACPA
jgi:hypothetical protein